MLFYAYFSTTQLLFLKIKLFCFCFSLFPLKMVFLFSRNDDDDDSLLTAFAHFSLASGRQSLHGMDGARGWLGLVSGIL